MSAMTLRRHLGAVAITTALIGMSVVAPARGAPAAGPDSVTLDASPDARNIARPNGALPKIASANTPATARINKALSKEDARWFAFVKDCVGAHGPKDAEASRQAQMTMNGPRYVSIVIHDEFWCFGTPHPDNDVMALVYDLGTGAPVDWSRVLPKQLADGRLDSVGDGAKIGVLSSASLDDLYVKTLKANLRSKSDKDWWSNCSDAVSDPTLEFVVWPDSKQGAVVLEPVLAHVVAVCVENASISAADLRKLGASPDAVGAIEAAKKSTPR